MFDVQYWKFFVYEMLFLWNTLHNCPKEVITAIISGKTDDLYMVKRSYKFIQDVQKSIIIFKRRIEPLTRIQKNIKSS